MSTELDKVLSKVRKLYLRGGVIAGRSNLKSLARVPL